MSSVPAPPVPWSIWPALPQASAHAAKMDGMMLGFGLLIAVFTIPVFVALIAFTIKYRRGSPADRSRRRSGNTRLEIAWSVIPFIALLGFFIWAAWSYLDIRTPPADALEINVVGKQWMWKFQHSTGQREINSLHVPVGRDIKLVMISQDVIHDMFLPALRIKQDVLPGRYTTLWFKATETGDFPVRCSQFCGTDHAIMTGTLTIMTPTAYAAWLANQGADTPLAAAGEALFQRYGCSGCHDPAAKVHAPGLYGLFGSPVPLNDGTIVTADERYIRDSLLQPAKEIAAGYDNIMPSFAGKIDEDGILDLIAYIKSLPANSPSQNRSLQ